MTGYMVEQSYHGKLKDRTEKFDFLTNLTIAYLTVTMPFDQGWSRASKNMVTVK